jgi:hypothetical protein
MKLSGKAWMSLAILFVGAGIIISALRWPFKAALFPMVVGVPLFILSAIQFLKSAFLAKGHSKDATIDFKLSKWKIRPWKRSGPSTFFLDLGFFFMVLLIGFPLPVPSLSSCT